ncbi:MAG: hypothetical protein M1823_004105 [Watsoniomyces obsoletus]|nr:MAG: hypothetical protein M1823_004105 [Watsoniomyces obsoletus]
MALATSPPASLAVPPTQNTALVLEFRCLYTHDLRRKSKRWQDGFLRFHTFNKRVMVYDLPRNFVGDCHWRGNNDLDDGDELELESSGALVQVGEVIGRTEQDLSGLFDKRQRGGQGREIPRANPGATPLRRPGVRSPTSLRQVMASRNESPALFRQKTTSIRLESATRPPRNLVAESPSVGRQAGTTNRSDARPSKRTKLHHAAGTIPRQPDLAGAHESGPGEAHGNTRRNGNREARNPVSRQIVGVPDDERPGHNRGMIVQAPAEAEEGLFLSENPPDDLQPAHPPKDGRNRRPPPGIQKPSAEPFRLVRAPARKKLVCEDIPAPARPSTPKKQAPPRPRSPSPRSKELSKFHQAQMERLQGRKKTKHGGRAEELDFLEQSQVHGNELGGNRSLGVPRPAPARPQGGIQNNSHLEGDNGPERRQNPPEKLRPPAKQSVRNTAAHSKVVEQGERPPSPPPDPRAKVLHPPPLAQPPRPREGNRAAGGRGTVGTLSRTTSLLKNAHACFNDEKDEKGKEKYEDIGPWSTEAFDLFDWRPEGHVYPFERE